MTKNHRWEITIVAALCSGLPRSQPSAAAAGKHNTLRALDGVLSRTPTPLRTAPACPSGRSSVVCNRVRRTGRQDR